MRTYGKVLATFKDNHRQQFEVEMYVGFSTSTDVFWLFLFGVVNHTIEVGMVTKAHGEIIEMKFVGIEEK